MTQAFKLPDLGEGIHEGEIVSVLVEVGDAVQEDQPILLVETDKATVEIPSPYTGTVTQVNVASGDLVHVGDELIVFAGSAPAPAAEPAPEREPAQPPEPTPEPEPAPAPQAPPQREGPVPASPATRRLARELGVDLAQVPPSGPAGLVTAEDVRAFAERGPEPVEAEPAAAEAPARPPAAPSPVRPSAIEPPPLPDFSRWGPVERAPLRSVRRATAKHMALAWSQIPHVNHQDVADVTDLNRLRREHKEAVEAQGGRLTLTVFVLKAIVAALKAYPQFNVSLDADAQEIVYKNYFHLGVAVDSDKGLLVPVVRDVDRKSITELAVELFELAERARSGQASLEEMQGGSFTLTNIGALGGTGFAPIVNYPEAAILGTGAARLQPVVRPKRKKEGYKVVPRLLMPLVLAFDHRVLDGAEAARFVNVIIDLLENPDKLLLTI